MYPLESGHDSKVDVKKAVGNALRAKLKKKLAQGGKSSLDGQKPSKGSC